MNFNNHGLIVPDISMYQDDNATLPKTDFAKMKAAGAMGVIIRAGQNSWVDPDFKDNWKAAKEAGLLRGSYWFYDSRSEPAKQANLWNAAIGNDLPELGLWTDLEEAYHGAYAGERYWKQFVLSVGVYFPDILHGVYTASWWWGSQTVKEPLFWAAFPLWVAQYGVGQADVVLPRPWLGKEPLFWQFTAHGDGTKYGVESKNIDLNYFNGDLARFQQLFGLDSIPDDGEQEEGQTMQGTVRAGYSLRVRDAAGADTGIRLSAGDVVYGPVANGRITFERIYRLGRTVTQLVDADGKPYTGSAATVDPSNGVAWMFLADEPEPTPDPQPDFPPQEVAATWTFPDGSIVRQAYVVKQ